MLIVIFFGGRLALQGMLPVADLVAFFLYLEMFLHPGAQLSGAWEAVQSSLAGADRVADLLAAAQEPQNCPRRGSACHGQRARRDRLRAGQLRIRARCAGAGRYLTWISPPSQWWHWSDRPGWASPRWSA